MRLLRLPRFIFYPAVKLSLALIAATLFAVLINSTAAEEDRIYMLIYYVPISVPFVAFVLDRLDNWSTLRPAQIAVELPVLALALTRAFYEVPFVSGHALFLTYAMLTCRTWTVRITGILVFVEVIYLKIFIWNDISLLGGFIVGCFAAWIFYRLQSPKLFNSLTKVGNQL